MHNETRSIKKKKKKAEEKHREKSEIGKLRE